MTDPLSRIRLQFAECGAAFHVNDPGVSAAALQQAWYVWLRFPSKCERVRG